MADGSFATLVSKDRNDNAVTNPIWVNLSDGTSGVNFTGTSVDVNVTNSITVTATDLDIRDIVHTQDSVAIGDGTSLVLDLVTLNSAYSGTAVSLPIAGRYQATPDTFGDGDATHILTDANGRIVISGSVSSGVTDDSAFTVGTSLVNPAGYLADETAPDSVDEGDIGAARMTLDRKQLNVLVDATTDSQRLAINSSGEIGVVQATHGDLNANVTLQINDVDVSASVPVPISRTAAANSESNPIYVYNTAAVISGTEIHDYDTAAAVASDATSNHDYTVTGTTFFLKSVIVSGSGNVKAEIQVGPVASLASKAVVFLNGRQGDTKQVDFNPPLEVPATSTGTVRVIRTNRQGAAADVYSTIIGSDV